MKLGNFKKIPETLGIDLKVLSWPLKKKYYRNDSCVTKSQKISCKLFHSKTYVILFRGFL